MRLRSLVIGCAALGLALAVAAPSHAALDHYKCYKVKKDNVVFPPAVVTVDQFGSESVEIKKGFLWCNPVSKNGGPIINATDHLFCYKIKSAYNPSSPPHISSSNQFGSQLLFAKKAFLLCVPGSKTIIP